MISSIASVTIVPFDRNVSRSDIECPGDTLSYQCSIQSNSESVRLNWQIFFPGENSVNITYDNSSMANQLHFLGRGITTVLSRYIADVLVESILMLTVLRDVDIMNGTIIECSSGDLDSLMINVYVNTSGEREHRHD